VRADVGLQPIGKRRGEQKFLSEFKNSVLSANKQAYWYKLIDAGFPGPAEYDASGKPITGKFDRHGKPIASARFMAKKPFDAFCIIAGSPLCIEAKFHSDAGKAWPLSEVREHQVEALMAALDAGAASMILLNVRDGLGVTRINRCYVIPIIRICDDIGSGMKSYKWRDLNEFSFLEWKRFGDSLRWDAGISSITACALANMKKSSQKQGSLL